MPSPFPGMNPWLEHPSVWHGFHHLYIARLCRQIAGQVAPRYVVDIDDDVYIHDESGETAGRFRPDVGVSREEDSPWLGRGTSAIQAPALVELPREDVERIAYLKILDGEGREVVTVVELLSPTNKRRGENRTSYLGKRRAILAGDVNLVEIDLLRAHPPMPPPDRPPCAYSVMVVRRGWGSVAEFWPIGLRDPLPIVPIPLRSDDLDARADLKAALDGAYDDAAYASRVYKKNPDPPLSPEDEVWARGFLTWTT
jgi:hypothetical protein